MGRATEFIDYINRDPKDFKNADGSYKVHYKYIDITPELKKARGKYRRNQK